MIARSCFLREQEIVHAFPLHAHSELKEAGKSICVACRLGWVMQRCERSESPGRSAISMPTPPPRREFLQTFLWGKGAACAAQESRNDAVLARDN